MNLIESYQSNRIVDRLHAIAQFAANRRNHIERAGYSQRHFLHVDARFAQRSGNRDQLLAGWSANDGNDATV